MGINLLHRKERLIITTIDIINDLGIQKLTTREIAKRQDVSEATIFRHFQNKNELLLAVLDYFTQFDGDILQSIKLLELKPLEALKYVVLSYAEYYENYPAITSILQIFDVFRYEPGLMDKILDIQTSRTMMLRQLVTAAIDSSDIRNDTDSDMLAIMISGLIREQCLNWRLNRYVFSLRERIQDSLELLINAFRTDQNEVLIG